MSWSDRIAYGARRLRWKRTCYRAPTVRAALESMTPGQLNWSVHISHRHKYVLLANPKTGMTSLKTALIEIETGTPPNPDESPHRAARAVFTRLDAIDAADPLEALVDDGYFFFTSVRNPYSRLASGYRSAIARPSPVKPQVLAALGLPPDDLHAEVSFEDFANVVASTPEREADPHWRGQSAQTLAGLVPHHLVIRQERYADGFAAIMDAISIPTTERPSIPHRNATTETGNIYSPEIRQLVAERFRADFERFDYAIDG